MRRIVAVVMGLGILSNTSSLFAQSASPASAASPFSHDAIRRAIAASSATVAKAGAAQGKSDWQRVQQVRLGSDVYVTLNGGLSASRALVESDDSGLTVMKFDAALPPAVTKTLRELVRNDPQRVLAISRTGSWSNAATKISLTPEGVFVAGQKISEWSSLLIRIDKADVVEVRTGKPGGFGRGLIGFLLGYVGGSAVGWAISHDPDNSNVPYVAGLIGGVAGAIFFTRDARGLIYRR